MVYAHEAATFARDSLTIGVAGTMRDVKKRYRPAAPNGYLAMPA